MIDFLFNRDKYECKLRISHSTVVQKSYGQERRFFCPPPCIYLTGNGWELKKQTNQRFDGSQDYSEIRGYVNNGTDGADWQLLDFSAGIFIAKKLCTSAEDKAQFLELKVKFSYVCGIEVGEFLSKSIKVISKPPKKRPTIRNQDCAKLFIVSGSKVALFSPRSQLVCTRYLHFENGEFLASSTMWKAFTIHLCDDEARDSAHDGFIHYGSVVKLVDSASGSSLPKMRIREVEKHYLILNASCSGEPLSQLHTCAFEMIDNEKVYLSRSLEKIVPLQAKPVQGIRHQINDAAVWTFVSAVEAEYRFYEALGPVVTPITPCPMADAIEVSRATGYSYFELLGRDFTPDLKAWFGATEVETVFKNAGKIVCKIPTSEKLKNDPYVSVLIDQTTGGYQVPITLVREDGVIYPTSLTYSFK